MSHDKCASLGMQPRTVFSFQPECLLSVLLPPRKAHLPNVETQRLRGTKEASSASQPKGGSRGPKASYVFLENDARFPETRIMIEPNLCKTAVHPDGHEVAMLDEITGEHLRATPGELERAGIVLPRRELVRPMMMTSRHLRRLPMLPSRTISCRTMT